MAPNIAIVNQARDLKGNRTVNQARDVRRNGESSPVSNAKSFPWIVIYCGANANVEQVRKRDWVGDYTSLVAGCGCVIVRGAKVVCRENVGGGG